MLNLNGYSVSLLIYTGKKSLVYRGVRLSDRQPVIIKVSNTEYPTARQLARYRREFEIAVDLDPGAVVRPIALERMGNGLALILRDTGALSLEEYLAVERLELPELLECFVRLSRALSTIHSAGIVHKDIKPRNIVIDPGPGDVRFIDFGISSRLTREKSFLRSPVRLEGTLSYIAPEQTGRMNRGIDYRADLYSLGVTMYELLTGKLPFESNDPAELVHAQMAVVPPAPQVVKKEIPEVVSNIVMKLMAKTPEDRYQSCRGLEADLEICIASLRENGRMENFALGAKDLSDQFHIPEKLYGREDEIALLLESFYQAKNGLPVFLLVSGQAGIGKSVLVNEIYQPITEERGYFISGKFDQYKRDVPYSALIQSFVGLTQQILAEEPERIASWKKKILDALGSNAQILIDVIPMLKFILGPQPAVAALPPAESQIRFQMYFQNFIRVFAGREHPLVIFLDDLQWADSASLGLLEALITDTDGKHLLMIGAYRDNEVDEGHPLTAVVKRIEDRSVAIRSIFLRPLEQRHVRRMLSDTFLRKEPDVEGLAALILEKTYGNPFFVVEVLRNLYRERLVNFDPNRNVWSWDLEKIKKIGITDNVVEFMTGRIRELPVAAQELLKLAACLGSRFVLDDLALIAGKSPMDVARELGVALSNGLVLPGDETYKYVGLMEERAGEQSEDRVFYDFSHDRVQQAAYSLIADAVRPDLHLNIGRQMLARLPAAEREDKLIDIVGHLNLGASRIELPREKSELARLNYEAGLKAKSSAALRGALSLFRASIACMSPAVWTEEYDLAFHAHLERAGMEHANLEFEEGERFLLLALEKATSDRDRARVQELRVTLYTDQGRFVDAIQAGLEGLRLLGMEVPVAPVPVELKRDIESLADLPVMADEAQIAGMRILAQLLMPAIFSSSPYFPVFVFTMVQRSLDFGNSPYSAFGYVNYAIILCGHIRDYDAGYRFGQLALKVQEKYMASELKGRVFAFYAIFVHSWKHHIHETTDYLITAHASAMLVADLYFAASAILFICCGRYAGGATESISASLNRIAEFRAALMKTGVKPIIEQVLFNEQFLLNLRGGQQQRLLLVGDSFDERTMMPIYIETHNVVSEWAVYQLKSILAFLFGDIREALDLSTKAVAISGPVAGTVQVPQMMLINSMVHAVVCDDPEEADRRAEHIGVLEQNLEQFARMAEHSPRNYAHFHTLVNAELHRLRGQNDRAQELYDEAIESARENHFIFVEAVASERAALLFLNAGRKRFAGIYMVDAHYAYTRWGALEKVRDLEERHSELLARRLQGSTATSGSIATSTTSTFDATMETHGGVLDMNSLMKAAQAISGELVLDRLLDRLMRIVLENAGAERVLLFLNRESGLFVEAEGSTGKGEVKLVRGSADARSDFSRSVVNYVIRSGEYVLLDDAVGQGLFRRDPYVLEHRPRSLLCLPILYQNRLSGMLYMENNLTVGAFTAERLESLNLLSGQIAISIEHALLYGNLEGKVLERTRELRDAQSRLLLLEKEATERQMAGGFAHEMRNALSGSRIVLEQILTVETEDPGLNLRHSDRVRELLGRLEGRLGVDEQAIVRSYMEDVLEDENLLESILKVVYKATMRGLKITKEILDYSKIGQDEAPTRTIQLSGVIRQVFEEVAKELVAHGVKTELRLSENLAFEGRENDFYSVVRNLVQNSIDAVRGSGQPSIEIDLKRDGDLGVFRIVDTGGGIPPENLDHIFDAFYSTKPETGTGLGLGIVKKIVNRYRGEINVSSQVGKGTEFVVRLPVEPLL